jgi:hypothetical protein
MSSSLIKWITLDEFRGKQNGELLSKSESRLEPLTRLR